MDPDDPLLQLRYDQRRALSALVVALPPMPGGHKAVTLSANPTGDPDSRPSEFQVRLCARLLLDAERKLIDSLELGQAIETTARAAAYAVEDATWLGRATSSLADRAEEQELWPVISREAGDKDRVKRLRGVVALLELADLLAK